jgi:hypothetical protein
LQALGELPALPLDLPVFPLANYGSKLLPISTKELIFFVRRIFTCDSQMNEANDNCKIGNFLFS